MTGAVRGAGRAVTAYGAASPGGEPVRRVPHGRRRSLVPA
ncbi:hypothetical protein SCOCK_390046 [Actinacidiphila cocklensis]|uniref:Uncharacterized protein n=1 Tax=Actinacidiphila cocklensis TaxID=887465 RepID=A0A9W4E941_9ACTN|nr:hypothetical protein SCOCK_390046 [Actinacidiphila cocklensis]